MSKRRSDYPLPRSKLQRRWDSHRFHEGGPSWRHGRRAWLASDRGSLPVKTAGGGAPGDPDTIVVSWEDTQCIICGRRIKAGTRFYLGWRGRGANPECLEHWYRDSRRWW